MAFPVFQPLSSLKTINNTNILWLNSDILICFSFQLFYRNSLKELHKTIEDSRKDDLLHTFELASHTFGVANILNHLSLLDDYFKTLLLTLQDE